MMVAAVGGWAFANGFRSAGAQAYVAETPEDARKVIEGLNNVPIVLLGESVSAGLEKFIEDSAFRGVAVVVLRDGLAGADSGSRAIRLSIERATGIVER